MGGLNPMDHTDAQERLAALARTVMADHSHHDEMLRWQQRALRAEGKLADLGRMLDDYRERGHPMPTYSQVLRVLQG